MASLIVFVVPCPTKRSTAPKRASPVEEAVTLDKKTWGKQYLLLYMHWLGNPSLPELLDSEQNTSPARFFTQVLKVTPC